MQTVHQDAAPNEWKKYVWACAQFLLVFYLASFAFGYLFTHRAEFAHVWFQISGVTYIILILGMAIRMIRKLSLVAIMIASPTVPLCMMILAVSLLPVLQTLDKYEHPAASQSKPSG